MRLDKKSSFKIGDRVQLKTMDEILERFHTSSRQREAMQLQQGKVFKVTGLPQDSNISPPMDAIVKLDKNVFANEMGNVIHQDALVLYKSCQLELNKELFEL